MLLLDRCLRVLDMVDPCSGLMTDQYQHQQQLICWEAILVMNRQYAPRSSKPLVAATIVHGANSKLSENAGAHDTWLHRHVEIRILEYRSRMRLKKLLDCLKLSMSCALAIDQQLVRF